MWTSIGDRKMLICFQLSRRRDVRLARPGHHHLAVGRRHHRQLVVGRDAAVRIPEKIGHEPGERRERHRIPRLPQRHQRRRWHQRAHDEGGACPIDFHQPSIKDPGDVRRAKRRAAACRARNDVRNTSLMCGCDLTDWTGDGTHWSGPARGYTDIAPGRAVAPRWMSGSAVTAQADMDTDRLRPGIAGGAGCLPSDLSIAVCVS